MEMSPFFIKTHVLRFVRIYMEANAHLLSVPNYAGLMYLPEALCHLRSLRPEYFVRGIVSALPFYF